jgi:hypothetical protein
MLSLDIIKTRCSIFLLRHLYIYLHAKTRYTDGGATRVTNNGAQHIPARERLGPRVLAGGDLRRFFTPDTNNWREVLPRGPSGDYDGAEPKPLPSGEPSSIMLRMSSM